MKTFARLDAILKVAVKGRSVDYGAVEKRLGELDAFLRDVAKADVKGLGADERLAFYTNAYNALVLRAFVTHGKKRVLDTPGFFDKITYVVAGEALTLNELEEKHVRRLVRGASPDPRVHFVVNCASRDCPPLAPQAYTGATMQKALEEQTRAFLTRPGEVAVDEATRVVRVVQLFEWYAADWGGEAGVRAFLARYVPAVAAKMKDPAWELDYRPYDWTPNAL